MKRFGVGATYDRIELVRSLELLYVDSDTALRDPTTAENYTNRKKGVRFELTKDNSWDERQ